MIFAHLIGKLTLLIWLNENVGFHPSFSRHGRIKASFILLIWLNENVLLLQSIPSGAHVGKLREVREVREKLRDKCPRSYGKRLLSLNFPNDRRE